MGAQETVRTAKTPSPTASRRHVARSSSNGYHPASRQPIAARCAVRWASVKPAGRYPAAVTSPVAASSGGTSASSARHPTARRCRTRSYA